MKKSQFGKILFSAVVVILIMTSCKKEQNAEPVPVQEKIRDTITIVEQKEEPPFIITYRLDSIADIKAWDSIFNPDQKKLIYALNRIEAVRVAAGVKLVIPDTLATDLLFYSPFPKELDLLDSIPKTVLIAQRIQAFGLYENGNLIKWGPVSSGKLSTPTPNGLHYGNYKAKRKISTVNSDWILPYYFNFMNFEGVGVHQYLLPGFPASHACVRLDMDDAKFIYDWAKQWQLDATGNTVVKNGTPFMVFGEYDFKSEMPSWTGLAADPEANFLNKDEIDTIVNYVKAYMKDPRNFDKQKEEVKDVLASL